MNRLIAAALMAALVLPVGAVAQGDAQTERPGSDSGAAESVPPEFQVTPGGVRERIQIQPAPGSQPRPPRAQPPQGNLVRVQIAVNFTIQNAGGDAEQRLAEHARRRVYEMAARECEQVIEVFAQDCRLSAINVNVREQPGRDPRMVVSGNIVLLATPRAAGASGPPTSTP